MTRKSFDPAAWAMPQPVSVIGTYDEQGTPDAMNAAWTGQYDAKQVILCLSEGHKTYKNIKQNGEFTISFGTKKEVAACDYVGIATGNKVADKIAKTGWTIIPSTQVKAPTFEQLPMTLECRLCGETDNGNLIADIIAITCDEQYLDESGKPDLEKMELITFNAMKATYHKVGGEVAHAWSVGKSLI